MPGDIVVQLGIPTLLAITSLVYSLVTGCAIDISEAVTAISIISALLCAAAIMVFQFRSGLTTEKPPRRRALALIDQLFDDLLWAMVAGFFVVLLSAIAGMAPIAGTVIETVLRSVGIAFLFNFVIVVCMCLKRLGSAYYNLK